MLNTNQYNSDMLPTNEVKDMRYMDALCYVHQQGKSERFDSSDLR